MSFELERFIRNICSIAWTVFLFFTFSNMEAMHDTGITARKYTFVEKIHISLWLYSPLHLGHFFSFLILYTVGRTPWTGD
jgi:hypothetical protein